MIITKEEQIQKLPVSGKKEMHSLACLRELKLILTGSGAKIFKFRYENKLTGDSNPSHDFRKKISHFSP